MLGCKRGLCDSGLQWELRTWMAHDHFTCLMSPFGGSKKGDGNITTLWYVVMKMAAQARECNWMKTAVREKKIPYVSAMACIFPAQHPFSPTAYCCVNFGEVGGSRDICALLLHNKSRFKVNGSIFCFQECGFCWCALRSEDKACCVLIHLCWWALRSEDKACCVWIHLLIHFHGNKPKQKKLYLARHLCMCTAMIDGLEGAFKGPRDQRSHRCNAGQDQCPSRQHSEAALMAATSYAGISSAAKVIISPEVQGLVKQRPSYCWGVNLGATKLW